MRESEGLSPLVRLLLSCLPVASREAMSGDLQECYRRDLARYGPWRARVRLYQDALASVVASRAAARQVWARRAVGVALGTGGDMRAALRTLRRHALLSASVVSVLGLGIGVATVGFAVLRGTALRGLPFEEAEGLVHLERARPAEGIETLAVPPGDFDAWRRGQRSFEGLAAYVEALFVLGEPGEAARQLWGAAVSADTFELLGVVPLLGRTFRAEEDRPGAADVVLLGHEVWQASFAGDPDVVGREVRINGAPHEVIGVMPPGFAFPLNERIWRPLALQPADFAPGEGRLDVFGRLAPGVGPGAARADLERIGREIAASHPESHAGVVPRLRTFTEEYVGEEFTARAWTLQAAALLILVLAVVNSSMLLATRAVARSRELALRAALGAGRWRLVRQELFETGLLGLLAAIAGLGLASAGLRLFERYWAGSDVFALPHGSEAPFWWTFGIDGPALGFAVAATAATVALAGLLPALVRARGFTRGRIGAYDQRITGRRGGRAGILLVAAQVAVCTGLLITAGLVLASARNLGSVGSELVDGGLLALSLHLPSASVFSGAPSPAPTVGDYPDDQARLDLWARVERELDALPTIADAALATALPTQAATSTAVRVDPDSEVEQRARVALVSPGFFEMLGVRPTRGRAFEAGDVAGAPPVAVVNSSFASRHWPGESAVGRLVALGDQDSPDPWTQVVGVVPDLWMEGVRTAEADGIYLPIAQAISPDPRARLGRLGLRYVDVLVEPAVGGADLRSIRATLGALEPGMPLTALRALEEVVGRATAGYRREGSFYLVLGALAFAMAFLGLFGVMADQVAHRVDEIGTRMALGASRPSVARLVLRQGAEQVAWGVVPGLWLAGWLQPRIAGILYQVGPWEAEVVAAALLTLAAATILACLGPALRAMRVDPAVAMRAE